MPGLTIASLDLAVIDCLYVQTYPGPGWWIFKTFPADKIMDFELFFKCLFIINKVNK